MSLRFRAAVLTAAGAALRIETVEAGPLAPGDVRVRMGAAGLCHTDLEVMTGQLRYPMPIVLGHEAAGTIDAVGSGVAPSRIGERVVLSWNPHCGHCRPCERGQPILCDTYIARGPAATHIDGHTRLVWQGRPLHSMFYMAAFAEYAVVTDACAIRVPDALGFDQACLIGCGVLTGVGAATRIAAIGPGDCVAVIGCGAVGLAAVQGARLAGARQVIALDLKPGKLVLARRMGATHAIDAAADPLVAIKALVPGGVDVVLEAAGAPAGFRLSVEICRPGGQVVWLGKVDVDHDITLRWGALMGEKRITRSSYGGARTSEDVPMLAQAALDGRLDLGGLVTQHIALDDIDRGFDDLRAGRAIRSVIVFEGAT